MSGDRRPARRVLASLALAAASLAIAPAGSAAVDPPVAVSGASPFPPACNGAAAPQGSVEYRHTEVEPWIDVDPTDGSRLVAMWQQDRYSDGGANGLGLGLSHDGGRSWTPVPLASMPRFTRCQGAGAGSDGDYERASDPWVSVGPDGDAYGVALAFNESRDLANAILVSESGDGGASWGPVRVIRRDTSPLVFNDKESITADPTDAGHVYVVWDRLEDFPGGSFKGPTWFARTTDGGATWEPAKVIFDPGENDQTIGNQVVVLPDGDLVNGYSLVKDEVRSIAVMRSGDKGATWDPQVLVSSHQAVGVRDPRTGEPVRTGDILPAMAADERPGADVLYMVWQDSRFTGGQRSQIALSRSSDGGASWSAPRRISTVPATQAFTPSVRVDAGGNVAVTYYDFRHDSVASQSLDTDVWFLRSTDGGLSFAETRLTPSSFDMRAAPVARGFFVGDYAGLAAAGQAFKPLFAQAGAAGTDVLATSVQAPVAPVPPVAAPVPPAAPAAPAPARARLRVARRGRLGRRLAALTVRCLQSRCSGRLELSAVRRTGGSRRPVILGTRSFRMRRGRATLHVRLSRRARRLTARTRRLRTRAVFSMRADRLEFRVLLRRR